MIVTSIPTMISKVCSLALFWTMGFLKLNAIPSLLAQSRAHRIGQVRPVMVYKLVSAAGVEEKILQSAAQKLGLPSILFFASFF